MPPPKTNKQTIKKTHLMTRMINMQSRKMSGKYLFFIQVIFGGSSDIILGRLNILSGSWMFIGMGVKQTSFEKLS